VSHGAYQLCAFLTHLHALSNEEKLSVYIRIVRLLLEEEEAGQAETYYNRAALLIHLTSDKTLQLQFKLCQARISDFGRKFVEAATRYHELSWVSDIDEEERTQALFVFSSVGFIMLA
jgi:COP9 signalosome complex subunit 4